MKGLRIDPPNAHKFKEVFGSVLADLDRYYWHIDTQSGPFGITDKPNFRKLDAEIDRYRVPVPEFRDTSTSLWRPGVLRFADLLVIDEWAMLIGILGDESAAVAAAVEIDKVQRYSPQFFDLIQKRADCAVLHIDGWWEVYSANSHLMDRISKLQGVGPTDSGALWRQLS